MTKAQTNTPITFFKIMLFGLFSVGVGTYFATFMFGVDTNPTHLFDELPFNLVGLVGGPLFALLVQAWLFALSGIDRAVWPRLLPVAPALASAAYMETLSLNVNTSGVVESVSWLPGLAIPLVYAVLVPCAVLWWPVRTKRLAIVVACVVLSGIFLGATAVQSSANSRDSKVASFAAIDFPVLVPLGADYSKGLPINSPGPPGYRRSSFEMDLLLPSTLTEGERLDNKVRIVETRWDEQMAALLDTKGFCSVISAQDANSFSNPQSYYTRTKCRKVYTSPKGHEFWSDDSASGKYQYTGVYTVIGGTLILMQIPSTVWTEYADATQKFIGTALDASTQMSNQELKSLAD